MREYTADELLEAREERVKVIDKLLKQYNTPLLAMRVNYPGLRKTNKVTLNIIQDMSTLVCTLFGNKVRFKSMRAGAEGPIFLAAVQEDGLALKKAVIDLEENHLLGRCLDLDVYDRSGRSISRQELGYPRRKCYLCEEFAQYCVRSKRHSEQEVIDYIEDQFRKYRNSGNKEV